MTAAVTRIPVRLRLVVEPGPDRCPYPAVEAPGLCIGEACRHHLGVEDHRCVLDEIDASDRLTAREIAPLLGVSFQRVMQIEAKALKNRDVHHALRDWADHVPTSRVSNSPDTAERSEAIGRSKDFTYAVDARSPRLALTRQHHETVRVSAEDVDDGGSGVGPRLLAKFEREAETAATDRAFALYVSGPPCWLHVHCLLSRGHAGECLMPSPGEPESGVWLTHVEDEEAGE